MVKKHSQEANHWIFRFVMALRTIPDLRYAMWDMARMRIRGVLDIKHTLDKMVTVKEPNKKIPLGKIFTSQRAVAILLRCHVNNPSSVNKRKMVNTAVTKAFEELGILWTNETKDWTDIHEAILYKNLLASAKIALENEVIQTLEVIDAWPKVQGSDNYVYRPLGNLSLSRNSFILDKTGLSG